MSSQSGEQKMQWAIRHMPILSSVAERFEKEQPFAGLNVVIALHLEAKTANLAYVMLRGGANVAITASNPITTQDDVAQALAERGVTVSSPNAARRRLSTRSTSPTSLPPSPIC